MKLVFVLVLAVVGEVCCGSFAPSEKQERRLLKCLLNGPQNRRCFQASSFAFDGRATRSISEDLIDILRPANQYLRALNAYRNEELHLTDAVVDAGSCAKHYPSMAKSWKKLLKRRGIVTRIQPLLSQSRNGSINSVRFASEISAKRNIPDKLEAADLVISRSDDNDSETYGRYGLSIDVNQNNGGRVLVYESMQATCSTVGRRYFVAGLNEEGVARTAEWLRNNNSLIEFSVKLMPQLQIVKDSTGPRPYRKEVFDIGQSVSAMVLHFSDQNDGVVFPVRDEMVDVGQGNSREQRRGGEARAKRSALLAQAQSCRRAPYIVSFENNKNIISPNEFDLGECVGRCDEDRSVSARIRLNATNHALSMMLKKSKIPTSGNPEPTVCCVPISYRRFYFVVRDQRGFLMSTFADNMVAEYCGCR